MNRRDTEAQRVRKSPADFFSVGSALGQHNWVSQANEISRRVIGACIEIHRSLGPGLLEFAYEECLCHELNLQDLAFERQKILPVAYKGIKLDCGYRLDVVVADQVIIELKRVPELLPVHEAQLLTYLKLSG